ncbi:hypothetical protein D3C84_1050950 [compost metagenome]
MVAEGAAAAVAVEQGRVHLVRQYCGHELGVVPQALQHGGTDLARQWVAFGQLLVVLGLCRLVARGCLAVGPFGLFQGLADTRCFVGREDTGNVQEHGGSPGRNGEEANSIYFH